VCGDSVQNATMSSQGQPGDDQSDDQADDRPDDEPASGKGPGASDAENGPDEEAAAGEGSDVAEKADDAPDGDRIARVAERIDKARSQAQDAGVLVEEDEEHFADSGATETEDDQTIAPPG
jgi:hypothetical protein